MSKIKKILKNTMANKKTTKIEELVWCSDVNKHVPKSSTVKIGYSYKRPHHAAPGFKFVSIQDDGKTKVHIFDSDNKKKAIRIYNNLLSVDDIRDELKLAEASGDTKLKYRAIFKHCWLEPDVFKEKFEPFSSSTRKTYKLKEDTSLTSLSSIIEEHADGDEVVATYHSGSIRKAIDEIRLNRYRYTGQLPIVEVYAIWSNYCPDTKLLFHKNYDEVEPMMFAYNYFRNKIEMVKAHI